MGLGAVVLTAGEATDSAANRYVLHVVPANGGGVDRYVRDICAQRTRDCVLHVVAEQCVFEAVATHRFIPIELDRLLSAAVVQALGRPSLLHVHSTLAPVREVVAKLGAALDVDYVLTLHDIDFAGASADLSAGEREARWIFVRNAGQRIVPGAFIAGMLSTTLGHEITWQLVENGVDTANAGEEFAPELNPPAQFQVAVVGALGPHKGLNFLRDVATSLPPEIRVVIVGYADGQLSPGWLQEDRLWVHGVFEPSELSGIVRRYGSRIALFPNRQPESYCYALSDAWCAGLPALGPASGAIGDRIAQTGAGWTFAPNSSVEAVATQILDCLNHADQRAPGVHYAVANLVSRKAMVDQLNLLYASAMKTLDTSPHLRVLEATAATHLNGQFFRAELQKLSGDFAFAQTQTANANQALQALTREYDGRGAWIATLEKNFAESQVEILRIEAARKNEHAQAEAALQDERAQAEAARVTAHAAHEQYAAKLQRDITDTLAIAHRQEHTIALYEGVLSMVPPFVRRWMLRRAERFTNAKVAR